MTDETAKKRRILPWVVISLAAVALSSAAFILAMPLDLTRFSGRIEAAIEERVNGDVELGRIVFKALPSPELTVTHLRAAANGTELLSADRLHARVRLLPLFSGRVAFETIEADRPSIFLVRGRDGALNIDDFLKKEKAPEEEEDGPSKKKKKPVIEHLRITGGSFSFIDRFPMQSASFEVTGISVSSVASEGESSFTAEGRLAPSTAFSTKGTVRDQAVDGHAVVKGLRLEAFNPYMKAKDASVSGSVDADLSYKLNALAVTNAEVTYRDLGASYPTTWEAPVASPSGSCKVSLKVGKGVFDLTVYDIVLNMKAGFVAKGSVHVEGPRDEKSLVLKASTTPVDLSAFLALLPTQKMSPEVAAKVRSVVPVGGTATIRELTLAGRVKEMRGKGLLDNPRVSAALSVKGASFRYGGLKTPFTGISGDASYRDRVLEVKDLSGRFSRQILDDLDGTVKNLAGEGSYDVALKGSFDVKDTLELAGSRLPAETREKLSRLDADGVASLSANLSGTARGKKPVKYSGTAALSNGSAYYAGLPVGAESIDAAVEFNNDRITFKDLTARTDSSKIALKGFVEGYRGKDPYLSLESEGSLTAETVSKALSVGPRDFNMTGAVPFTLSAEGRRKDFSARASVDATTPGLFIKKFVDKAPGFPLSVEAEGGLKGELGRVDRARLSFGESVVTGSGARTLGIASPPYSVSVVSEQLRIADIEGLSPFLNGGFATSGVVSFRVKTFREEGGKPSYEGKAGIKDGSFETGLLKNPVSDVTASAELAGNRASVVVERLETGSTVMEGRVDVLDIAEKNFIFDVSFPRLHAGDLVPAKREGDGPGEEKADEDEDARPAKKKKARKPLVGSGVIRAAEGDLFGHQFKNLQANIGFDETGVNINPVTVDIDGGTATASVFIFLDEADSRVFTAEVRAKGLQIDRVTGASSPRKFLSGTARARVELTGMKGDGPLVKRMNGKGHFAIEKGRLWKFGFITDIFSIVNIISLDELFKSGLPYKDITGSFKIGRGLVSSSDLAFDSDSLRMSGVGSVRLPENTIDLTLALHPFVTIDKIITNIPIVGWIITGKEESAVSFYFDIEGPLKKPRVTPLPVKTIERSVFGILERLLKAPFNLFK